MIEPSLSPPSVPILALVDGDAYGIDILSVYKHGSTRMRHENDHLAADRLQWVGLWASELASYVLTSLRDGRALISRLASHYTVLMPSPSMDRLGIRKDTLLPITKYDEKKASEIDFSYRLRVLLRSKPFIATLLSTRAPHVVPTEPMLIFMLPLGTYAPETS